MSFPDDELKRMEKELADGFMFNSDRFDLNALISRLESAEDLLPAWQQQNGEPETRAIWLWAEEVWKKAAGKS